MLEDFQYVAQKGRAMSDVDEPEAEAREGEVQGEVEGKKGEVALTKALDYSDPRMRVEGSVGLSLDGSINVESRGVPAINSDEEFSLALEDYARVSRLGGADSRELARSLKSYRGARFFNDGVDPVLSEEDKEMAERMNDAVDLRRDWQVDAEARKRVEQKRGREWREWFEGLDEDDRAKIGAHELLKAGYGADEDEFALVRYMKTHDLPESAANEKGVWQDFGMRVAIADKDVNERRAQYEKAFKHYPKVTGAMFNGDSLLRAVEGLDSADAVCFIESFGVGTKGADSMQKARAAAESLVYDDVIFGKRHFDGSGAIVGEFVSRERSRAMTDMDKGNLDELAELKKVCPEAYRILLEQVQYSSDALHDAWYTVPGLEPAAATFTQGIYKTADWVKRAALSPFTDTSISQEQAEVLGDLSSVADVYAPRETDSTFRSWADPIGNMLGSTALFMATRGAGTFGSTANDEYLRLKREGNGEGYSQWHALPQAVSSYVTEMPVFGKWGRVLSGSKLFKAVPLSGSIAGRMSKGVSALSSFESKIASSSSKRFAYNTFVGGTGESFEEFVAPPLTYAIDKAFSLACFDTEGGMTLGDVKEQWNQLLDPQTAISMYLFSGMMSGVYIPAMRQDAKFLSQMPDWLEAAGVPEARAKEIANMPDFRERMEAGRVAMREGFANRPKEEVVRSLAEAAERLSLADPLRPDMPEVEGLMELGKVNRMTRNADGSWRVHQRDERESFNLTEEQAAIYLNEKVGMEEKEAILEARSLALTSALVAEMEASGDFIFERMRSPGETVETLRGLAKAAGVRMEELREQGVLSPELEVDARVSEHVPLGKIEGAVNVFEQREEIAKQRGEVDEEGSGVSYAYRVRLDTAQTVIRFAEGKMNFSQLLEEYYESKVSDSLSGSRTKEWWGSNLRQAQEALRDMGVVDTDFIKKDGELTHLDVLEACSYLGRSVAMSEAQKSSLPEPVRDFLRMLAAWTREALGLARLGKGFEVAAKKGFINKDFADDVYDLVGVPIEMREEAGKEVGGEAELSGGDAFFDASASFVRHGGKLFAPNGKVSRLNASEYEVAQSAVFKDWFGDWEAKSIQNFMKGEPVASIEGKLFSEAGDAGKELVELISTWMGENYGEFIKNPVLGDVRLSKKDVKDSWREGRNRFRAEAFRFAPEIISKGIIIGNTENYKGKAGVSRLLVAAPVEVDGEKQYGVVVLQYDQHIKRLVFHDVYTVERTMLENLEAQEKEKVQSAYKQGATFREEGQRSKNEHQIEPALNILRKHLFVNTENVSNRVDENGEPLAEAVNEWMESEGRKFIEGADGGTRSQEGGVAAPAQDDASFSMSRPGQNMEGVDPAHVSGRFKTMNDRVGLSNVLNDDVEPVRIDFEPEKRGSKDWREQFKMYVREQLAGKVFTIGNTGYEVYFKGSGTAMNSASKGVRNQQRAEAGQRLDEVIQKAYHLASLPAEHKEGEGKHRKALIEQSDSFEKFGYPISINGQEAVFWFAGHHLKGSSEKQVQFYEFGLTGLQKEEAPTVHAIRAHRAEASSREEKSSLKVTLGEVLRGVNGKIAGMPEIMDGREGEYAEPEAGLESEQEAIQIKAEAEKQGSYMRAPSGVVSKLDEKQWVSVRTQAFKSWFGDWEDEPEGASKVVDENGEPMVVFHGSLNDFSVFDVGRSGENFKRSAEDGGFIFFSSLKETTEDVVNDLRERGERGESRVYDCFVRLKNPYVVDLTDAKSRPFADEELSEEMASSPMVWYVHPKELRAGFERGGADGRAYDGVVLKGRSAFDGAPEQWVMAVDAHQVKSASKNRGSFDAENADISFSLGGKYTMVKDVGLLTQQEAVKRLIRRYEVRDIQKRRVIFGGLLREHFSDDDKDRSERRIDLLLAEDTVRTGRGRGKYRRHYGKVYEDASGKKFGMLVVVVKNKAGKDEVLTYTRVSPVQRLWNGVEKNDKK